MSSPEKCEFLEERRMPYYLVSLQSLVHCYMIGVAEINKGMKKKAASKDLSSPVFNVA